MIPYVRQPSPKSESKSKIPYVRQSSPKSEVKVRFLMSVNPHPKAK